MCLHIYTTVMLISWNSLRKKYQWVKCYSIDNQYTHWFSQEAPGKISITCDGWTADNTKGSFLGMTAHWIEVKDGKWKLRSEVIAFQPVSGEHSGDNLGRYFVGLCERVGIMSKTESKVRFILVADKITDKTITSFIRWHLTTLQTIRPAVK